MLPIAPFIHTFTHAAQGERQPWSAAFAFHLAACPVERADAHSLESALGRWLADRIRFLNSAYAPGRGRALAIRYITAPDPASLASGRITIAMLGRSDGRDEQTARASAAAFFEELRPLLGGHLPDYDWDVVTAETSFQAIWSPLDWDSAHVAEIRHREEVVLLETLHARPALGKSRAEARPVGRRADALYVIHPFVARTNSLAALLRTLLLHSEPVVWDTVIEPVRLTDEEDASLAEAIARCGRFEQPKASAMSDVGHSGTVHQRRARALSEMLLIHLLKLQDAPFLLRSALASPSIIPRTLLETVGVEVTEPVGAAERRSHAQDPAGLLLGGYDVVEPADPGEESAARDALRSMSITMWGASLAPSSLRRLRSLVDAHEAAGIFRPPVATSEGLVGIEVKLSRTIVLPPEVSALTRLATPNERLTIGENRYLAQQHDVVLLDRDRWQHMYVVGQTGTGKTTLLTSMIEADMAAGKGLTVIDPHGDLFEDILRRVPADRVGDVVVLDPTDQNFPVGVNLLECGGPEERHAIIREMRSVMERLLTDLYGRQAAEWTGPLFYQHMQMNMMLVMSRPSCRGTLLDFHDLFGSKSAWKKWVPPEWPDPALSRWIAETLPGTDYTQRARGDITMGEYVGAKFEEFVFDPRLRLIFGQRRSSIDFRRIMDEGQIFLVNLAKGHLTEANARFLGLMIMARLQVAALSRVTMPRSERRPHYIYVDEFQSLATDNFVLLLSEARKFGISLVLANQFVSQIKNEQILQSVFGNVGNLVAFRVGQQDAALLEPYFAPSVNKFDLTNQPNWHACMRTTVNGQAITPFTLRTVRPTDGGPEREQIGAEVRRRSREAYGRPRTEVEAEIARGPEPASKTVGEES